MLLPLHLPSKRLLAGPPAPAWRQLCPSAGGRTNAMSVACRRRSACRYHFPSSKLLGAARAAHPVKWADVAAVRAEVDKQVCSRGIRASRQLACQPVSPSCADDHAPAAAGAEVD